MKSKNSKIKKAVTKKIPLEKTAYYTLRRMLFPLQKEIENIRIGVWDLECMLREREWEASEKKMNLVERHSFLLYAERAKRLERSLASIIGRLDRITIKNV